MSLVAAIARSRVVVTVAGFASATMFPSVAAQSAAPRVLVRDSVGTRIPYASVQSGGSNPRTASDSGVVLLTVPRADSLKLLARRIGFEPFEGWIHADSAGDYHVRLRPLPQNLNRISIYSRDAPLSRTGFYDRQERASRSATVARFWTPEAIELRSPSRVSSLMEGENIVRVRPMHGKAVLTGRGGTCPMGLVVDGQRMTHTAEEISTREGEDEIRKTMSKLGSRPDARDAAEREFMSTRSSIDDIVSSLSIAALEVYASVSAAPPELQRAAPSYACGLVVVWTGRR